MKVNWEFSISGSPQELYGFSRTMPGNSLSIYESTNAMIDANLGDYRMSSSWCDNEDDYQLVWQIGYELLSILNGACILYDYKFWKIKIESLWKDGKLVGSYEDLKLFGFFDEPQKLPKHSQETTIFAPSDVRLQLAEKARNDFGTYLLLKYFDLEANWMTYYKILDTIKSLANKESKIDILNLSEKNKFTKSANNFSIVGLSARHGFKQQFMENKTSAMTFPEAHEFIRTLSKEYLKSKYPDLFE